MGWLLLLIAQAAAAPDGGSASEAAPPAHGFDLRWSRISTPEKGAPASIGQPGAGCVQGAVALPLRGPGYVVAHPERHREYGHPTLVAYVRTLAAAARRKNLGLVVVGDLGQPRGGPTPTGHRSHQNGIDVDIWYAAPSQTRTSGKVPLPDAPSVVDLRTKKMLPAWTKKVAKLVETAATNPAVDRIFVHPAVKRTLCQDKALRGPWLIRVRPWWGHQDHFHVRLVCPGDSPDCIPAQPLADGDGCAQLAWWFSNDARTTSKKRGPPGEHAPQMPDKCEAMVAR